MSSFKKIEINPALFNMGGKTKKNREKKEKPIAPIISPNILRNQLLKRIKEHKTKEIKDLEIINKNTSRGNSSPRLVDSSLLNRNDSYNNNSYSNEFNDSIEYLRSLSNEKKKQQINEKRKEEINQNGY